MSEQKVKSTVVKIMSALSYTPTETQLHNVYVIVKDAMGVASKPPCPHVYRTTVGRWTICNSCGEKV